MPHPIKNKEKENPWGWDLKALPKDNEGKRYIVIIYYRKIHELLNMVINTNQDMHNKDTESYTQCILKMSVVFFIRMCEIRGADSGSSPTSDQQDQAFPGMVGHKFREDLEDPFTQWFGRCSRQMSAH